MTICTYLTQWFPGREGNQQSNHKEYLSASNRVVRLQSPSPPPHCIETEKYAHVTFFFNGGIEKPFDREDRLMVPSPKVPTYDLQPEMSAEGVGKAVSEAVPVITTVG